MPHLPAAVKHAPPPSAGGYPPYPAPYPHGGEAAACGAFGRYAAYDDDVLHGYELTGHCEAPAACSDDEMRLYGQML